MTTQSLRSDVTNAPGNVLSVYLNIDQSQANNLNKGHENALSSRLQSIGESLAHNVDRKEFEAAAAIVKDFVAKHRPSSKALVIFANSSRVLLTRDLHLDIATDLQWGKPRVAPYIEALDEFERYLVVVTDKWQARILSVCLGSVEFSDEFQDTPHTTHIKATGMDHLEAQARDQRHADENAKKHVKHILSSLENALASYPSERIIVGGNVEAVGELLRLAPKTIRTRIVGTIHSSMADSFEKVIEAAHHVYVGSEREHEARGVARLLEFAGGEHKAVTGVDGTLNALREKKVLSLYYADDLRVPGKTCVACGALYPAANAAPCISCGTHLEDSEDLIDQVLIAALNSGARVEQVRGTAANKLREVGGIGALLRY